VPSQVLPHQAFLSEHRAAVREFISAVRQLDSGAWLRPVGPRKWSPALITAHVTLSIEAFTDETAGRAHMATVMNAWKRFVARTVFLRRLLRTGIFPVGFHAPRETRPSSPPSPQAEAIAALGEAVTALESTLAVHPDPVHCRITHPYFGRLPLITGLQLLTLHARHHQGQLPRRAGGLPR